MRRGEKATTIYKKIDRDLNKWVTGYLTGETVFTPAPKVFGGGLVKSKALYRLPYDPDQPLNVAYLTLQREETNGHAGWKVKLECSISKAGPAGLVKLISMLDEALPCKVEKLLGTMRVRRLDPAIDIIGVQPIDLIAHVPKPGKRLIYVGDHGQPESL